MLETVCLYCSAFIHCIIEIKRHEKVTDIHCQRCKRGFKTCMHRKIKMFCFLMAVYQKCIKNHTLKKVLQKFLPCHRKIFWFYKEPVTSELQILK